MVPRMEKTAQQIALGLNQEAERLTQLAKAYKATAMILSGMVPPNDIEQYVEEATIAGRRAAGNE